MAGLVSLASYDINDISRMRKTYTPAIEHAVWYQHLFQSERGRSLLLPRDGQLAQMERELLVERTRAGLVAAKKLGRVGGRKRRMTESKIRSGKTLLISGVSPKRMFEKSQTDARRLRIRRVAAISMSVSEVCTLYS